MTGGASTVWSHLPRACRLPFLSASVLPFVFGSLLGGRFSLARFLLGLAAVAGTHLSANLVNDYADSKSGADWSDRRYYGFFGGSKLIQEGVLSARFYLAAALLLAALAAAAIIAIAVLMNAWLPVAFFVAILALAWQYSAKPLQLAYRRLGELTVFALFGPATVVGGCFIQTGVLPPASVFLLSLPLGFMTASILLANEVPDAADDGRAGKFTLVSVVGARNGHALYAASAGCALGCVAVCFGLGLLGGWSLLSFGAVAPIYAATGTLKRCWDEKPALKSSSRLAILAQSLVGLALIVDAVL